MLIYEESYNESLKVYNNKSILGVSVSVNIKH